MVGLRGVPDEPGTTSPSPRAEAWRGGAKSCACHDHSLYCHWKPSLDAIRILLCDGRPGSLAGRARLPGPFYGRACRCRIRTWSTSLPCRSRTIVLAAGDTSMLHRQATPRCVPAGVSGQRGICLGQCAALIAIDVTDIFCIHDAVVEFALAGRRFDPGPRHHQRPTINRMWQRGNSLRSKK